MSMHFYEVFRLVSGLRFGSLFFIYLFFLVIIYYIIKTYQLKSFIDTYAAMQCLVLRLAP